MRARERRIREEGIVREAFVCFLEVNGIEDEEVAGGLSVRVSRVQRVVAGFEVLPAAWIPLMAFVVGCTSEDVREARKVRN